jgi:hypothetical protein
MTETKRVGIRKDLWIHVISSALSWTVWSSWYIISWMFYHVSMNIHWPTPSVCAACTLVFLEFPCLVFLTYSGISSTKLMLWTVSNYPDNSSIVLCLCKQKRWDNITKDDIHEFHTTVLFRVHVTFSFRYVFTVITQILAIYTPVLVLSTSNHTKQ